MPTPADLEQFVKTTKVKDLRHLAEEQGRQGFVAQANADGTAGQVRWQEASTTPDGRFNNDVAGETAVVEQNMITALYEGLPAVERRTAQERFRVLFERLVQTGLVSHRQHGYPIWPRSIQQKLAQLGWKERDPDVYGQCRALAERLFIEAGQKHAQKDQRKSTLDWHGHYNHVIEVPSLAASRASQPAPGTPSTSVTG